MDFWSFALQNSYVSFILEMYILIWQKSSLMMNPLTKQVRIGEGLSLSSYFDKYFSIGC